MSDQVLVSRNYGAIVPAKPGVGTRLRRITRQNVLGTWGVAIVVALALVAIFAEQLAPYDPHEQVGKRLLPPGGEFLLGTDQLGRDVFSRLIYGSRVAIGVGGVSVGIALLIGVGLGLVAGYYGGLWDASVMRVMDLMFTLPTLVLALALAGVLGAGTITVIIAITVVTLPSIARLTRAPVLSLRNSEFVMSSQLVGADDRRIMGRHIFPNIVGLIIVQATIAFADAILIEAALSFLGLGVQPPAVSWGNMLGTGRQYIELANGLSIFPGVAIMIAVLGFNLAGDGLRDVLDPRLKRA